VVILLIGPLDAFDGALARKLGRKQGGFGAFLDSTLDRLAEIILFGGFILYYVGQGELLYLSLSYVAITGSVMVSYARARAEGLGFDCKVGIASRVERYGVLVLFLLLDMPHVALIILAIATYITVAQRMYHVWRQSSRQG
jgi:CDP-diacylglycerol--glycerol-3-phosphate 3-phosphatidyltransferase